MARLKSVYTKDDKMHTSKFGFAQIVCTEDEEIFRFQTNGTPPVFGLANLEASEAI